MQDAHISFFAITFWHVLEINHSVTKYKCSRIIINVKDNGTEQLTIIVNITLYFLQFHG